MTFWSSYCRREISMVCIDLLPTRNRSQCFRHAVLSPVAMSTFVMRIFKLTSLCIRARQLAVVCFSQPLHFARENRKRGLSHYTVSGQAYSIVLYKQIIVVSTVAQIHLRRLVFLTLVKINIIPRNPTSDFFYCSCLYAGLLIAVKRLFRFFVAIPLGIRLVCSSSVSVYWEVCDRCTFGPRHQHILTAL